MSLDKPILSLGDSPDDVFTVRNACEGIGIFGGTGSGKTSGSGAALARSYIKQGFGGVVLTVKPDELQDWQTWASTHGREDDLIVFDPDHPYRFDFLLYEQNQGEQVRTTNIINLLSVATEIVSGAKDQGGGDAQFWKDAGTQLISKAVDLLVLANVPLTVANLLKIINTAPTGEKAVTAEQGHPPFMAKVKHDDGKARFKTFFALCFAALEYRMKELNPQQTQQANIMRDYFINDFALLGERTRSSVKMQVTTTLYQLVSEDVGTLLCGGMPKAGEISITPEQTYLEGKIIILNMPVMVWKKAGQLVQGLFKYLFQRCMEKRNFKRDTRPVFLWSDEAQYFLSEHDQLFLTTARSTGCSTVFLTQNIENYYSVVGEHVTKSLLGNLQTKIFHQNTDLATNNYASDLIGKEWKGVSNMSTGDSFSMGTANQLINRLEPESFNMLITGGSLNNLIVQGIVIRSGRREYTLTNFMQR